MMRPKKSRLDDVVGLVLVGSEPVVMSSLLLVVVVAGSVLTSSRSSPPALYRAWRAAVF